MGSLVRRSNRIPDRNRSESLVGESRLVSVPYTFEDFIKHTGSIVSQIEESGTKFDYVMGVYRGGVIPAMHIAYKLGIPCQFIKWQIRDGNTDVEKIFPLASDIHIGNRVLLVDDISDSGKTFSEINGSIHSQFSAWVGPPAGYLKTASLVVKQGTEFEPNYSGMVVSKDSPWLDFWWEV